MARSFHLSSLVLNGKCSSEKHFTGFEVVCGPVFHENVKPGHDKTGHSTFLFTNIKRKEFIHPEPLNNSSTHQAKYDDNMLKFFNSEKSIDWTRLNRP